MAAAVSSFNRSRSSIINLQSLRNIAEVNAESDLSSIPSMNPTPLSMTESAELT